MHRKKKCRRKRCVICRKWFHPHVSALNAQKTCSLSCQVERQNFLARKRRSREIYQYRTDERIRQRECRRRKRENNAIQSEAQSTNGIQSHATLSPQPIDLADVILKNWDETQEVSRARLRRQLNALLKDSASKVGQGETANRACHALPCDCNPLQI
jgi:hypothetical protein